MVEPVTTGIFAILSGIIGSQAAQTLQAIVTSLKDGFDFLKIVVAVLTAITILGMFSGTLAPKDVPFAGIQQETVLSHYIIGFPECKSAIGPMEMCALPSLKLINAVPDAFKSLGTATSSMFTGITSQTVDDSAKAQFIIDFVAAIFGVLFSLIPLTFLAIKITLAWEAGYALMTASSQYRLANLGW